MSCNLFRSSIEVLKSTPIQSIGLSDLLLHQRNLAEGFNKIFSAFAVEICGCENPADRVHLKKAVWQQTVGMRLAKFEKGSEDALARVARMECPVSIFPKSSDESSPSKIILSSKLLRAHFRVNESTTCRGCSKKGRCPFVHKTVSNKYSKTSLGALMKVLFGITQSCRLHLKDPEKYALLMSAEEMEAAADLTEKLRVFLEPSAVERQLRNVPVADRNAVRAIVKKQLKKKEAIETEIKKERKDGMPDWMRQRIGEPIIASSTETTDDLPRTKNSTPKFDIDADDWIPEEKEEEYSRPNLKFDESVHVPNTSVREPATSLDTLVDLPVVKRFSKFDQIFTKKNLRKEKSEANPSLSPIPTPTGGYMMETLPVTPTGGVEYIKPQMMKGKTVLDNVSVAGKLWGNVSPWISELKFLQRVPYVDQVPVRQRNGDGDDVFRAAASIPTGPTRPTEPAGRRNETRAEHAKSDMFHLWQAKRDRPRRVALIDKRFDYNDGSVGSDSLEQYSTAEIVTGSPKADWESGELDERRKKALEAALGSTKFIETDEYIETGNRLRFPKFPEFDDPTTNEPRIGIAPRSRGGVDITSLMRPGK